MPPQQFYRRSGSPYFVVGGFVVWNTISGRLAPLCFFVPSFRHMGDVGNGQLAKALNNCRALRHNKAPPPPAFRRFAGGRPLKLGLGFRV